MATTSLLSIQDYLQNTNYKPDVEYLDGELRERPMVSSPHGLLQTIIGSWFFNHREEWKLRAGVEVRTQVSATRVRLPDVVVDRAYKWPNVLSKPPVIVIEILSPGDTYAETERLARDYRQMGIENIWLIDPETRTGRMCIQNAWIETNRFELKDTNIYLDLNWLFTELDRYDNE